MTTINTFHNSYFRLPSLLTTHISCAIPTDHFCILVCCSHAWHLQVNHIDYFTLLLFSLFSFTFVSFHFIMSPLYHYHTRPHPFLSGIPLFSSFTFISSLTCIVHLTSCYSHKVFALYFSYTFFILFYTFISLLMFLLFFPLLFLLPPFFNFSF